MKGNLSAAVRSIKINIFRCVDGGCDCIVLGVIARTSAISAGIEHNPSHHLDAYMASAVREVFAGDTKSKSALSRIFEHIDLVTNPSIVSRSITPVKSQTIESPHPASLQGGTFVHNLHFPGATKLTVKFDKRSGKGSGNCSAIMKVRCTLSYRVESFFDHCAQFFDYPSLLEIPGAEYFGEGRSGEWAGVGKLAPLVHSGCGISAQYITMGSMSDWGYQFTVTPLYPAASTADMKGFIAAVSLLAHPLRLLAIEFCTHCGALSVPGFISDDAGLTSRFIDMIIRCLGNDAVVAAVAQSLRMHFAHADSTGSLECSSVPMPPFLSQVLSAYIAQFASSESIFSEPQCKWLCDIVEERIIRASQAQTSDLDLLLASDGDCFSLQEFMAHSRQRVGNAFLPSVLSEKIIPPCTEFNKIYMKCVLESKGQTIKNQMLLKGLGGLCDSFALKAAPNPIRFENDVSDQTTRYFNLAASAHALVHESIDCTNDFVDFFNRCESVYGLFDAWFCFNSISTTHGPSSHAAFAALLIPMLKKRLTALASQSICSDNRWFHVFVSFIEFSKNVSIELDVYSIVTESLKLPFATNALALDSILHHSMQLIFSGADELQDIKDKPAFHPFTLHLNIFHLVLAATETAPNFSLLPSAVRIVINFAITKKGWDEARSFPHVILLKRCLMHFRYCRND